MNTDAMVFSIGVHRRYRWFHGKTAASSDNGRLPSRAVWGEDIAYTLAPRAMGQIVSLRDGGTNGTDRWLLYDHIGVATGRTNSQGASASDYELDAFGNLASGAWPSDGWGITTKHRDPETGLYYFNARWYDPETGRWISPEPTGADGPNLYVFCANDSVNRLDYNGLWNIWAPHTWGDSTPIGHSSWSVFDSHASWGGFGAGAYDGYVGFVDAFLLGQLSDPCNSHQRIGRVVGAITLEAEMIILFRGRSWSGPRGGPYTFNSWSAVSQRLHRWGFAAPGEPIHHVWISRTSRLPGWLKHGTWNLNPVISRELHTLIHRGGWPAFWYGVPTRQKLAVLGGVSGAVDALTGGDNCR